MGGTATVLAVGWPAGMLPLEAVAVPMRLPVESKTVVTTAAVAEAAPPLSNSTLAFSTASAVERVAFPAALWVIAPVTTAGA